MQGFYPESSTLELYTKQKKGCQGLVRVRITFQNKITKIHGYIRKMATTVLSEYPRQQKPENEEEEEQKTGPYTASTTSTWLISQNPTNFWTELD